MALARPRPEMNLLLPHVLTAASMYEFFAPMQLLLGQRSARVARCAVEQSSFPMPQSAVEQRSFPLTQYAIEQRSVPMPQCVFEASSIPLAQFGIEQRSVPMSQSAVEQRSFRATQSQASSIHDAIMRPDSRIALFQFKTLRFYALDSWISAFRHKSAHAPI